MPTDCESRRWAIPARSALPDTKAAGGPEPGALVYGAGSGQIAAVKSSPSQTPPPTGVFFLAKFRNFLTKKFGKTLVLWCKFDQFC